MTTDPNTLARLRESVRQHFLRRAHRPVRLGWTFRGALSASVSYAPMLVSLLYPPASRRVLVVDDVGPMPAGVYVVGPGPRENTTLVMGAGR